MTSTKHDHQEICDDCPNVLERREKDSLFRESILIKLGAYDIQIEGLSTGITALRLGIKDLSGLVQSNFNTIYFRIGVISGTIGLITGAISALSAVRFLEK